MWVRGLKQRVDEGGDCGGDVAPHVGAWIETISQDKANKAQLSHPMWVRGLKLKFDA